MRYLLLVITFLLAGDRAADRDALLAADRALSERTGSLGVVAGFMPALTDDAAFLYPGAPLLHGAERIRAFVGSGDSIQKQTWSPLFADVSADGRLGYSYGWTRAGDSRGKYLACWQKTGGHWRLAAFASTRPVSDSSAPQPAKGVLGRQVRGRADSHELIAADSTFAALSVASGAKTAFTSYAAVEAISFGGGPQITEGREAIGAIFDGFPDGAVLEWWPVAATIAPSGDLGCTVGEARISSLNRYSKYLTIWRRQPDGSWKFVADGGNARPAS
jgi:ketosteroid isomerase-like protein